MKTKNFKKENKITGRQPNTSDNIKDISVPDLDNSNDPDDFEELDEFEDLDEFDSLDDLDDLDELEELDDSDTSDTDASETEVFDVETIDIETSLEDFEDDDEASIREMLEAAEQLDSEESEPEITETSSAESAPSIPADHSAESALPDSIDNSIKSAPSTPADDSTKSAPSAPMGDSAESAPSVSADDSAENTASTPASASGVKRSPIPYVIIGALSVSLVALGALTFMSLDRLASLQSRISQLQQTVVDISDSASTLSQKAEELKQLQDEEASQSSSTGSTQTAEIQGPQLPSIPNETMEEQGTLSPSSGKDKTFTNNTDSSMDSLLVQIEPLLPQNNGNWSVYVCNLSKGSEGVIGGGKMQAASLIKLYIMGTVYENYESLAQLHGKENLDGYLRSMITVSDNDAANILVNWLGSGDDANGMAMVNEFCKNHGYTETSMGRMLLASNENGDNYTSVTDCGKFLKEIYQINAGTVTDSTLSHADSMYYLLKLQERNNKMPAKLPDGVHVAHKTGELTNVENDAGIIYDTAQGIDLVVCFMSENLTDAAAAQTSIAENTRLIYGYYNE